MLVEYLEEGCVRLFGEKRSSDGCYATSGNSLETISCLQTSKEPGQRYWSRRCISSCVFVKFGHEATTLHMYVCS